MYTQTLKENVSGLLGWGGRGGKGYVGVQSGVLPKKFGHKLFLSLSAQLDNV